MARERYGTPQYGPLLPPKSCWFVQYQMPIVPSWVPKLVLAFTTAGAGALGGYHFALPSIR